MAKKYSKEELLKAYECVSNNKKELSQSEWCGCISCMAIFRPYEIEEWYSDEDGTAICPYCFSDTILGDKFGFEIDEEFLVEMNKFWRDGVRGFNWHGNKIVMWI